MRCVSCLRLFRVLRVPALTPHIGELSHSWERLTFVWVSFCSIPFLQYVRTYVSMCVRTFSTRVVSRQYNSLYNRAILACQIFSSRIRVRQSSFAHIPRSMCFSRCRCRCLHSLSISVVVYIVDSCHCQRRFQFYWSFSQEGGEEEGREKGDGELMDWWMPQQRRVTSIFFIRKCRWAREE